MLRDNLSLLEQLSENPDLLSGVKTQFEGLDRVLVGLGKGDLVLVGTRPGMGKTSFVMNIAANFAKATKEKVAVFSLEMSSEQLVNRMLASEALIDNNALRTGKMSTEEWKRIAAAASLLSETQIYIDDTPGINVNMMKAKLRRLKDVKLVIIDYLQLMQSERHTDNRVQEVAEMTRALKLLAKEFACPIILCSQLSRSNEARSDKRPMLSDLRDSGAIEQDADIVIFLYRNDYYSKEEDAASGEAIVAECLVAKNGHGPTGTVNLIWQGKNFRFYTPEEKYGSCRITRFSCVSPQRPTAFRCCQPGRVTVCLSGGADSVALLRVLLELRERYALTVAAVHVHHGIRGDEASRDERFCRALCERLGVPLTVRRADSSGARPRERRLAGAGGAEGAVRGL